MHVLLFDIDGTLVSTGGAGKAALEAAVGAVFNLPRVNDQVPMSGRTDRAILRDLLRAHDLDDHDEHLARVQTEYLARLPASLQARPGRTLPGVARLVEMLAARSDVTLGLLTGNLQAGARVKLGHFSLFDYFPFGGFGDRHLDRNAVAAEALAAARAHVASPIDPAEQVWVIGDTPLDVACARSIGARVVAVATGSHDRSQLASCAPDVLVETLAAVDSGALWP